MLILGYADVRDLLAGRDAAVVDAVRTAYRLHDEGATAVPPSTFLRFGHRTRDRIIGLPAYAGAPVDGAGMKWVSSWPGNIERGLPRASACLLLNDMATGRVTALLEGSLISAARTGAGAALAASLTLAAPPRGITLVGCGPINLEVLRYARHLLPSLAEVVLHDTSGPRAHACAGALPGIAVRVEPDLHKALGAYPLVSIATNASEPHLALDACQPGAVVLHVSLRDIHPRALLDARNVVDDVDHVLREGTSLELAVAASGRRDFIEATIGQLVRDGGEAQPEPVRRTVVSPFGLGVLDLAVAVLVRDAALAAGRGRLLTDFHPEPAP
ncbi:MAG TPA: 2,3-diaminopropionate biosynthesis protein SbnB [Rugosimonospora sp.]|nr:2,3-diaminopropionate biosynthesis protein SbnB [Rugosimonospora sp.]